MLAKFLAFFHKLFSVRTIIIFVSVLLIIYGSFVFFGQKAKRNAIAIFNAKMAEQSSLNGSVSIGDISGHLDGTLEFKDLVWLNRKGQTLLKVSKGRMVVSPIDVIFDRIGVSSLHKIELEEADFILFFDEKMKAEIVAKERVVKQDNNYTVVRSDKPNLVLPEKLGHKKLTLKNCSFTVIHNNFSYQLNKVDGNFAYDKGKLNLTLKTGKFGGTMVGDSLEIKGEINTLPGKDKVDVAFKLNDVVPASLGLGNIENSVTLTGKATGTIHRPVLNGDIFFQELDFPRLHFNNVKGNYHYENNIIHVMDVKGQAFGGNVDAFGQYDFRSREHKIFIEGYNLDAEQYFKAANIHCRLYLNMELLNDGTRYGTAYRGFFKSGEGKYDRYSFNSLSANFWIQRKNLNFTKVVLDTDIGEIHAKELDVVNGKVHIKGISWHPHHRIKRSKHK